MVSWLLQVFLIPVEVSSIHFVWWFSTRQIKSGCVLLGCKPCPKIRLNLPMLERRDLLGDLSSVKKNDKHWLCERWVTWEALTMFLSQRPRNCVNFWLIRSLPLPMAARILSRISSGMSLASLLRSSSKSQICSSNLKISFSKIWKGKRKGLRQRISLKKVFSGENRSGGGGFPR